MLVCLNKLYFRHYLELKEGGVPATWGPLNLSILSALLQCHWRKNCSWALLLHKQNGREEQRKKRKGSIWIFCLVAPKFLIMLRLVLCHLQCHSAWNMIRWCQGCDDAVFCLLLLGLCHHWSYYEWHRTPDGKKQPYFIYFPSSMDQNL